MGTHDYVPRILQEMGVELKVTKVRIKPGKPFVFGVMTRGVGRGREWGVGKWRVGVWRVGVWGVTRVPTCRVLPTPYTPTLYSPRVLSPTPHSPRVLSPTPTPHCFPGLLRLWAAGQPRQCVCLHGTAGVAAAGAAGRRRAGGTLDHRAPRVRASRQRPPRVLPAGRAPRPRRGYQRQERAVADSPVALEGVGRPVHPGIRQRAAHPRRERAAGPAGDHGESLGDLILIRRLQRRRGRRRSGWRRR